jgi:hypothetical protein
VVASISPSIEDGVVHTNRVIRIRFDRAIDPDSFLFDNGLPFPGDWQRMYYPDEDDPRYNDRDYKNISIECPRELAWAYKSSNWEPFYYPPELSDDGTILTIEIRPDARQLDSPLLFSRLTVTLNRDIKDTRGISLGRTYPFVIEAQDEASRYYSPTDDPPYPTIYSENFVTVKATAPTADHPDGEISPGANFCLFSSGNRYGSSDYFAYNSDDNWIYIAFQTDLYDYTFAGALVYEYYLDNGSVSRYTGEKASPVYDPVIVKTMTEQYKEKVPSDDAYGFNPSRPVRVVKYNLSKRTGTGDLQVILNVTPLDIADWLKSEAQPDTRNFTENLLFYAGSSSNLGQRIRFYSQVFVWYTPGVE